MGKFMRERIQYHGVSDYIPYEINSFTQMNINEILKLNEKLPGVDEILKVGINSEIINSRLVKTAIGTSIEGQRLTGWKYITEGYFNVRIDYCTIDKSGALYTFKSKLPFNNATTLAEDTHYNCRIIDNVYVEDIFSQVLSEREILVNISFLFTAENC